jgi:uncharacterized protein
MPGPSILIAAFSGRAAAMAARRAGLVPLVADLFADADTRDVAAGVRQVAGDLEDGFDAGALLEALAELATEAVEPPIGLVYGAGFEDRPELLARIGERWLLLGNAPEAVAAVKHPWRLAETLAQLGVPHPDIMAVNGSPPPGWLMKRQGGAGGGHVGEVGRGPRNDQLYAQRQVIGRAVSALFVSGARCTEIVGFSEQWTAPAPGRPFRFGGAVCPAELPDLLADALSEAVRKVAHAFALRGLNSADFLVGPDGWWLLEINPRPGATLDIFDTPDGALFRTHIQAVRGQDAPVPRSTFSARAMQVVYAPVNVRIPAIAWPEWTADRPLPYQRVPSHGPLCTILATADSPCEARRLCLQRSNEIQKHMGVEECRTASTASRA